MKNRILESLSSVKLAVISALVTFIIYIPALFNGYVNWDDHSYVYENLSIRTLSLDFFIGAFTSFTASNWHPLTMISYALDYYLWGLNPFGFHLTNIVFHAANTFLVYLVIKKLIETAGPGNISPDFSAMITAILFGVHPIHVESVAWVSERKDVLFAFFLFLSVLSYLRYVENRGLKPYLLSFILFLLSLMSKPMAITLPLILVILDFYPLKRIGKENILKILLEKAPFLFASVASAFITLMAQRSTISAIEMIEPLIRVFNAGHAYVFYIRKMLLPVGLAPFYPHPVQINVLSLDYAGSLLLVLLITGAAIWQARKKPLLTSVWFFYIITLIPVIGLLQVGLQAAADRYAYLPSIGPFALAGILAGYTASRLKGIRAYSVYVCAVLVFAALAYLTIKQIHIWKNGVSLWTYEISYLEKKPEFTEGKMIQIKGENFYNFPRTLMTYYYRGNAYDLEGEYGSAIKDFTKTIEMNPQFAKAYLKRGQDYLRLGEYTRAIEDLNICIGLDPYNAGAYYRRSDAYKAMGRFEEAEKDFMNANLLEKKKNGLHNGSAN